MSKEVIGIIGTIAAGKDTAGDYFAKKLGIPSFQISSPLKQICAETGVDPTRENLIALGTKIATEYGDGYLAEYIIERMPDRAVITGMRQLGQIASLRIASKLILIALSADSEIRFSRTKDSGKLSEAATLDGFLSAELAENSAPNTQRLFECVDLADYHIANNGTFEELYEQLDKILTY